MYIINSCSQTCTEGHGIIAGIFQIDGYEWDEFKTYFVKYPTECSSYKIDCSIGSHECSFEFDMISIYQKCVISKKIDPTLFQTMKNESLLDMLRRMKYFCDHLYCYRRPRVSRLCYSDGDLIFTIPEESLQGSTPEGSLQGSTPERSLQRSTSDERESFLGPLRQVTFSLPKKDKIFDKLKCHVFLKDGTQCTNETPDDRCYCDYHWIRKRTSRDSTESLV